YDICFFDHCVLASFCYCCFAHHGSLRSLPTRRSSDLLRSRQQAGEARLPPPPRTEAALAVPETGCATARRLPRRPHGLPSRPLRSEEHTSELQSRENLVCRLLLEKIQFFPTG